MLELGEVNVGNERSMIKTSGRGFDILTSVVFDIVSFPKISKGSSYVSFVDWNKNKTNNKNKSTTSLKPVIMISRNGRRRRLYFTWELILQLLICHSK